MTDGGNSSDGMLGKGMCPPQSYVVVTAVKLL